MKTKYRISDSATIELYIEKEKTDDEADGEFLFDTLKDAQKYCLDRIDYDIKQLQRTREEIIKVKK